MNGVCALCRRTQDLQRSHLLPRSLYRFLRSASDNPNPVFLAAGTRLVTSKQAWKHLLCRDCEQRFHRNGEDWVLRRLLEPGSSFPLLELLERSASVSQQGEMRWYNAASVTGVEPSKLQHFALSVFWRAAVADWNIHGERINRPDFGKSYSESIRSLLAGDTTTIPNAALQVVVCDNPTPIAASLLFPIGGREDAGWMYRFLVPGVQFVLWLGSRLPRVVTSNSVCSIAEPRIGCLNYESMITQGANYHLDRLPIDPIE